MTNVHEFAFWSIGAEANHIVLTHFSDVMLEFALVGADLAKSSLVLWAQFFPWPFMFVSTEFALQTYAKLVVFGTNRHLIFIIRMQKVAILALLTAVFQVKGANHCLFLLFVNLVPHRVEYADQCVKFHSWGLLHFFLGIQPLFTSWVCVITLIVHF